MRPSPSSLREEDRYLLHALEFESVLRASLYRFVRNRSDVDELLQDTYLRLLTIGFANVPPVVESMRAYCVTVARNVALDWLRHQKIVSIQYVADMESAEKIHPVDDCTGEVSVNMEQELTKLVQAVAECLPPKCAEVFLLRKIYGYSQKEIAASCGISENTVEQHLTKGTRMIRPYLLGMDAILALASEEGYG
jgi:RNA polymerase sigma factor (sigma-70 family)